KDHAPPDAAAAARLSDIEKKRIGTRSCGAHVIDRALACVIFCPGALPLAALLEDLRDAVDRIDGNHEQRGRAQCAAADAQNLPRAHAVELDAQRRDITPRADLLAFNNDRGDNTVEHRIAQLRTVASVRLA